MVFDLVRTETFLKRELGLDMDCEETRFAVKCCCNACGKPGLNVLAMT